MQVSLSTPLEERLRREADRQGLPVNALMVQLLEKHLPALPDGPQAAALAMLERWIAEDSQLTAEEAAENAAVLKALDDHRPSYRKLFTDLLKD